MLGPIFEREVVVLPRRAKHFFGRWVYAIALFSLICTAWLLLTGIQPVRNVGDFARFGTLIFQFLAPLQLLVLSFMAAIAAANVVAHEKDRRTMDLLLLTSLSNAQVVVGKIAGGLMPVWNWFFSGLPVAMLVPLLGGATVEQVVQCQLLTAAAILASGALGATMAFWREKTFQAIALTLLVIVLWLALGEVVAGGWIAMIPAEAARWLSPARAIWSLCQPMPEAGPWRSLDWLGAGAPATLVLLIQAAAMTAISWLFLRIWNPSRQARPVAAQDDASALAATEQAEAEAAGQPNRVLAWKARRARAVWNWPILWREVRTWAYGRKVLIVRLAYLLLFALTAVALQQLIQDGTALGRSRLSDSLIPAAAGPLAPLGILSLVMINALAVNSITNERDGQALDFLLMTEITPWEFILSKLLGAFYVAKEMILLPMALVGWLWWKGGMSAENLWFTLGGWLVMVVFVIMLGIHCGMIYSRSRTAIGVSLGTVFFLFLGIITCMLIMISFRGSFGRQLAPFLAIILGGGTGLFMALGHRNPSPAIALATFGLPFLTFFAITSFILRNQELTVFSVVTTTYAFATAAMLIPAISEFDFATGRTRLQEEDAA